MNGHRILMAGLVLCLTVASTSAWAEKEDPKALAKALQPVKVSLDRALAASEATGQPISAKFEIEDGRLQLSVYTMRGKGFSEVLVDTGTGKVSKSSPIADAEDLKEARVQGAAMAKGKVSLRAAAATALKANPGYRAVSIEPALKDGHPVATISLLKGESFKTVIGKLD